MRESLLTESGRPRFFYGYIVLAAALVLWITCWGTYPTFGIFFKSIAEELDFTRTVLAGAFSLGSITMALMGAVAGKLSDRFGPRLVISTLGAFLGIGYLLMSQITTLWQTYFFWVLAMGVGASVVGPALMSTISRWFFKRRGLAIAIVASGAGIGGAIFNPVAAWLALTYGWRSAWIVLGTIAIVFMSGSGLFLRREPAEVGQLPDGARELKEPEAKRPFQIPAKGLTFSEAARSPQFWILSTILLCFGMNRGITVHIAPHITDIGFSLNVAASVLAANAAVSIAGRLLMGMVVDRIGGRRSFIIAFIFMPAAFLTLLWGRELWSLYLFAVFFGFSWGGLAVLRFSAAGELFGVRSLGAIMGVVEFFATAGSGITPIVAGRLFDIYGNYELVFLVFAIVGAIGFLMSWFLRPVVSQASDSGAARPQP